MAIQLKRSASPSSAPQSLAPGELAINTYDARVFWADHLSVVRSFTFRDYALASHAHDASAITSGTIASARLGTGTASSSTYLRGDGAWATINAPTPTGGGASGTWSISITGNAGSSTYNTYQTGSGTANNFNTNFTETPAHNRAFREMSAGGPQGSWWFVENLRHSNASNYWGRQNAWGWEDNANELWSRNVQNGVWGSWVRFIHSGNYNSYAPTLTGGGASGTWNITSTYHNSGAPDNTGNVQNARVIRNSNSSVLNDGMYIGYGNSNSGFTRLYSQGSTTTHFYVTSDGNAYRSSDNAQFVVNTGTWAINVTGTAASETLATVCSRGANASGAAITVNSVYAGNWFRSTGNSGWYSETHGGGIWMTDSTWVRVYNNKQFYADNIIQSGASVRAPIFYDSQDTAYYCDPNGTSRLNAIDCNNFVMRGTNLYIGDGVGYTYVHFRDSDEGERLMHCNSNRIGFLNQSGGWGSWCNDDGSWSCYGGAVRALEVVGGWQQYGGAMEVRTDSNGAGTQDGPKIFFHKGGAKFWSAGIEPYGSHGFSIWEDGSTVGWGTQRFTIAPGGNVTIGGSITTGGNFYAPAFIDSNNNSFWVNPSGAGFNLSGGLDSRVIYSTFDGGISVYNAEGTGTYARLGAAWGRPGVYNNTSFTVGAETQIDFVIANNVRMSIASDGNITHTGEPAYFVRAFANFNAKSPVEYHGTRNISSITYRNAVGKFTINFTRAIVRPDGPTTGSKPAIFGSVGNASDTATNTTMRFGARTIGASGMTAVDITIVSSGGQGVPSASNAMTDCSFMAVTV